jgi:hypothetical protein
MAEYLRQNKIDEQKFKVINKDSVDALPLLGGPFDIGLVDGKHAFPWPIIDGFYIGDRLVTGGIMILDDTDLAVTGYLDRALKSDKNWEPVSCSRRWSAYRKLGDIRKTAWHLQPIQKSWRWSAETLVRRLIRR